MKNQRGHGSEGVPVGTTKIRTRHKRGSERRAWIKIDEPNVWKLRAQIVWEAANGPLHRGFVVHHKNGNKLDDAIGNLEAITKAEHLAEHRAEFDNEKRIASFTSTRRRERWSTKSATKRTGHPLTRNEEQFAEALRAISNGMSPNAAAEKFGVPRTSLYRSVRAWKR